jgi:hypothetical protein
VFFFRNETKEDDNTYPRIDRIFGAIDKAHKVRKQTSLLLFFRKYLEPSSLDLFLIEFKIRPDLMHYSPDRYEIEQNSGSLHFS